MPERAPSRFFYGYVVTACGFAIWLIGWGTFTPAFSVFLKPLIDEFSWSRADASLAYSLSFFVLAVLGVVMGWLTDRLGPRLVMTILGSFLGLSYLLLSQINTLWQFQAAYGVVAGIGGSTITIPIMVTTARWFHKKRAFMMGVVQAGMGIGGLVFPPLMAHLILAYGWRNAYMILGVITLTGMVSAGLFLRRDPSATGQLPDGMTAAVASGSGSPAGSQEPGFTLHQAFRMRSFWLIAGLFCSFGFCRSAFMAHVAAHVQELGFSLTDGANVTAVVIGSTIFGRVGMGRVADRIGGRASFAISFSLTTVSLVVALFAHTLPMLYVFAFIFGFGWGNQAVLRFSVPSEVFGLASLGVVTGTLAMAESGAAMFGSYYAGYLFDLHGNYTLVFWSGIVISIAGIFCAAALKPGTKTTGAAAR
jgi:MFS family permease